MNFNAFFEGHLMRGLITKTLRVVTPSEARSHRAIAKNIFIAMKLTAFILLGCCLHLSAKTVSQTVNLSASNMKLEEVLQIVERQTGFTALYNAAVLQGASPITIEANNEPLDDFLTRIFKDQPLNFTIKKKTILIRKNVQGVDLKSTPISLFPPAEPIRGVVKDSTGAPLSGATVFNKRTKKSVQTNGKGEFSIEGEQGDVLMISYVGFEEQIATVKEKTILLVMRQSSSPLDEVQIQAYGKTSRRFGTGNITTVTSEEIAKQNISNPLYALFGKVPNLTISTQSGLPGAPVKLQLRGQNTIGRTANSNQVVQSEPLIVIDGIPVQNNITAATFGTYGPIGNQISALSFIRPQDIEQIDVLIDADATSIYGSRGANGVILITTKKARSGNTNINVNFQSGWQSLVKRMDLMNTQEYLTMRKEAYVNDGLPVPTGDLDPSQKNRTNYDLTLWNQERYTDWQKVFLGGSTPSLQADASVSGGTSFIQYLINGAYNRVGSPFPGGGNNQTGSGRISLTGTSSNQKLQLSLTGSYYSNTVFTPSQDFTGLAIRLAPNAPKIYNLNGSLNWEPDPSSPIKAATWKNPYAELKNTTSGNTNTLNTAANISYRLTSNIFIKAALGFSDTRIGNVTLNTIASQDPATLNIAEGSATHTNSRAKSWSIEPQVVFSTPVDQGKVEILAGATLQGQNSENNALWARQYKSDALLLSLASARSYIARNSSSEYKYSGVFARINYNIQNRYILNVNARRDGSSRFGPGNQFGNFWSVGGAWIFSNSQFIRNKLPFLSFGKLRASYGNSGNDGIGDYGYVELYNTVLNMSYQGITLLESNGATNPYYHWETTRKLEIGFEGALAHDRIVVSVSYWRNRSADQLGSFPVPSTSGNYNLVSNRDAKIQNSGWDFSLNSKNISSKNFNWTTAANFGIQYNKLLVIPTSGSIGGVYSQYKGPVIGEPFSGYDYVYEFRGLNSLNGLYQFTEINGNATTNHENFFADKRINKIPTTIGIQNSVSYKRLSLDFFIQLTKQLGRNYLYDSYFVGSNPGSFISSGFGNGQANQPKEMLGRWQNPNDVSTIQRFTSKSFDPVTSSLIFKAANSDLAWVDASFIRLRNISLSYNVPEVILNKIEIRSAQVYIQAQNVLTITRYRGLDPEIQNAAALPLLRDIRVGISLQLK